LQRLVSVFPKKIRT